MSDKAQLTDTEEFELDEEDGDGFDLNLDGADE
jgi:hypothetical protein